MPEEKIDIIARMQDMGTKFTEYKDAVVAQFKNMDVEIRDWNFSVGKYEKEYIIDFKAKVAVKPRSKI